MKKLLYPFLLFASIAPLAYSVLFTDLLTKDEPLSKYGICTYSRYAKDHITRLDCHYEKGYVYRGYFFGGTYDDPKNITEYLCRPHATEYGIVPDLSPNNKYMDLDKQDCGAYATPEVNVLQSK